MRTLEKREEKIRKLTSANQEANLALKAAEQKAAAAAVSILPVAAAAADCGEEKSAQSMEAEPPRAGYVPAET